MLGDEDPDPAATLRAHLAEVEEDLARRVRLRDHLTAALATRSPHTAFVAADIAPEPLEEASRRVAGDALIGRRLFPLSGSRPSRRA